MGDFGKALDIEYGATWVRYGLAKHRLGVRTEGCLYLLVGCLLGDERTIDAELLQGNAEEVVGAAVNLVRGNEVVAGLTNVKDSVEVSSLT